MPRAQFFVTEREHTGIWACVVESVDVHACTVYDRSLREDNKQSHRGYGMRQALRDNRALKLTHTGTRVYKAEKNYVASQSNLREIEFLDIFQEG